MSHTTVTAVPRRSLDLVSRSSRPFVGIARKPHLEEVLCETSLVSSKRLDPLTSTLIDAAPICIVATDLRGTILAMNTAAEQLTEYRRREVVGVHSLVLFHDPAELSAHSNELSEQIGQSIPAGFCSLSARASRGYEDQREWTFIQRGGNRVSVSMTLQGLHSASGEHIGFLAMAFDITERKKLTESITHMTQHDQLTGLPNRLLLEERLRQAMKDAKQFGRKVAVYNINIDHFRRFNDSLGNAGGDTVLRYVAKQLVNSVRKTDTVARIASDEFVVIMPDFIDQEAAEACAETIQRKISTPTMVSNREIRATTSVGLCFFPDSGEDVTTLLKSANAAMLQAKKAGRANLVTWSQISRPDHSGRLELEEDLRHALARGEFSLNYQPQIDCATGVVTGMEALLRWNSAKRGSVPPSQFIPIAEEIGLMVPISEWIFRKACEDCAELQIETGQFLKVAVNLSPRQFSQRTLVKVVQQTLASTGLSARNLELEITEEMLMVNSGDTMATLNSLRSSGVSIAIDDFGTGYSSFGYILNYRADRLKIDRSFIAGLMTDGNATAIVRAIIAMAHSLNIAVVAEGVETNEQLCFLKQKRCDYAQGFLFARAVPKAEFAQLIQDLQPTRSRLVPCTQPLEESAMALSRASA